MNSQISDRHISYMFLVTCKIHQCFPKHCTCLHDSSCDSVIDKFEIDTCEKTDICTVVIFVVFVSQERKISLDFIWVDKF